MGQMYHAEFSAIAVSVLQDIFEVLAATDNCIIIHGFEIFQTTDVGDAEEEILQLETVRGVGSVTSGSGGGTITAEPVEDGFAAAAATVERNNTTRMIAGSGVLDDLEQFGWNIRIPLEKIWTPETRPVITPGDRWTLALPAAPNDEITVSGKLTFEEIGG